MRDMGKATYERRLAELGWGKAEFMGYRHRNGLGISELNYRTRRAALAAYIAAGEKHDRECAEREARKAVQP